MIRSKHAHRKHRRKLTKKSVHDHTDNQSKIKHILEYGVLAPSTHNTQPWLLRIEGNSVYVFADHSKKIPEADPTGRDLYMSLGALIKNIELASDSYGIKYSTRHPSKIREDQPVAVIEFDKFPKKASHNSQLLFSIAHRQNYRGFFEKVLPKSQETKKIISSAGTVHAQPQLITDPKTLDGLARLTAEGLKMAYAKPEFRREIGSLINHNLSRKRHGLHGYSLRMNMRQSVVIPKVVRRKDIGARLSQMNYKSFVSAPAAVVLYSEDSKSAWLESGKVLQEIMVKLTAIGINPSIYAAAIEMGNLRTRLAKLVPPKKRGLMPQLIVCIGPPKDKLPYSARRKLREVLID